MESFPLAVKQAITPLHSEVLFTIGSFPITNTVMMGFFFFVVIFIGALMMRSWLKVSPSRGQLYIESFFELITGLVQGLAENKEKRVRELEPILTALFVFLLVSNTISLLPLLGGEILYDGKVLFRSPTSDFSTTFALALGAVILMQLASMKEYGFLTHIGKYIKVKEVYQGFKRGIGDGFMAIVDFLIGLLDIIGELAKIASLSLRLFGNVYAGQVLLVIIMGALAYGLPVLWLGMSTFSGIIQAVVFVSLVGSFYMLSVKPDDETS